MKVRVKLCQTVKKGKKKVRQYSTVDAEFDGDWRNTEHHILFRKKIHERYPGNGIVVYSPTEKSR